MSDQPQAKKRGGKRRPSIFTQRAVQRALRAAKAAGENRTLIIHQDGRMELAPVVGEAAERADDDLDRELKEFQERHGQG